MNNTNFRDNIKKYGIMYDNIVNRVGNGEITMESAVELNNLALDKYIFESAEYSNFNRYSAICDNIMTRLNDGEITTETANELNSLAFDKYIMEAANESVDTSLVNEVKTLESNVRTRFTACANIFNRLDKSSQEGAAKKYQDDLYDMMTEIKIAVDDRKKHPNDTAALNRAKKEYTRLIEAANKLIEKKNSIK